MPDFIAAHWEEICRTHLPYTVIDGISFLPAQRWWGTDVKGIPVELDLVAMSPDKKHLLIGECKWSELSNPSSIFKTLREKTTNLPWIKPFEVHFALFAKSFSKISGNFNLILPDMLIY
jgi:hypothetical protein